MTHRAAFAAALAGVAIGWTLAASEPPAIAAPPRATPKPEWAFSSGAMRSEQVLREIAATLRSIDDRVARVEAALAAIPASRQHPHPQGAPHVR